MQKNAGKGDFVMILLENPANLDRLTLIWRKWDAAFNAA